MSESILSELINKRAIVGFITPRGNVEMTVCRILGVDDKFVKVRTDKENKDPKIISPGITTYLAMSSIDSVVDASDDEIYNKLMKSFAEQRAKQLQQLQQQRQAMGNQPQAAPGTPPPPPPPPPAPAEAPAEAPAPDVPEKAE